MFDDPKQGDEQPDETPDQQQDEPKAPEDQPKPAQGETVEGQPGTSGTGGEEAVGTGPNGGGD